jgi:hypothetical protein
MNKVVTPKPPKAPQAPKPSGRIANLGAYAHPPKKGGKKK